MLCSKRFGWVASQFSRPEITSSMVSSLHSLRKTSQDPHRRRSKTSPAESWKASRSTSQPLRSIRCHKVCKNQRVVIQRVYYTSQTRHEFLFCVFVFPSHYDTKNCDKGPKLLDALNHGSSLAVHLQCLLPRPLGTSLRSQKLLVRPQSRCSSHFVQRNTFIEVFFQLTFRRIK